jgi:hypothetical protein
VTPPKYSKEIPPDFNEDTCSLVFITLHLVTENILFQRYCAPVPGQKQVSDNAVFRPLTPHCSIIRSEIMALTIGTQLGSHEITGLLGKGGMGEVYRARDLKLKREVAIKILPGEFAQDSDRVSRFQREAEVLASLDYVSYCTPVNEVC